MKSVLLVILIVFQTKFSIANPGSDSCKKVGKVLRPFLIGTGAIAGWGLTYRFGDNPIQRFSQQNQQPSISLIARLAEPLGRTEVQIPIHSGLFLTGILLQDRKLAKAGISSLTAILIADLTSTKLKYTFERHRPNSGSDYNSFDGPNGENLHRSLPSGHTSSAFASATAIASVYKDVKWVAPVAYGMAGLVGLSRIYTNHHWASDVLAGAALGFVCGKLSVAGWNWLERKNITFIPSFGRHKNHLTILYSF